MLFKLLFASTVAVALATDNDATCVWVKNNYNSNNEVEADPAASKEECIANVREKCPTATIANYEVGGNQCFCQFGNNMNLDSSAKWENCLLAVDNNTAVDNNNAVAAASLCGCCIVVTGHPTKPEYDGKYCPDGVWGFKSPAVHYVKHLTEYESEKHFYFFGLYESGANPGWTFDDRDQGGFDPKKRAMVDDYYRGGYFYGPEVFMTRDLRDFYSSYLGFTWLFGAASLKVDPSEFKFLGQQEFVTGPNGPEKNIKITVAVDEPKGCNQKIQASVIPGQCGVESEDANFIEGFAWGSAPGSEASGSIWHAATATVTAALGFVAMWAI